MIKKLIVLNLLGFCVFSKEEMKFHEYSVNLWSRDKIPFEFPAYKLLKASPIKKNINYLAVPWGVLIVDKKLNTLPKIKINGGFTITRSTRFREIIPLLKNIGIDVLFTPHATGQEYDGIKVLPIQHFNLNGVNPSNNKDILYSFIGCDDHPTRKKLFEVKHSKDAVVIKRAGLYYFQSKMKKEQESKEYRDVLSRSRYSLCLSGYGPGTLRLWESLQAGAIPVIVGNIALPNGFDWDSCIVKISENDLTHLQQVLGLISQTKELEMRNKCIKAHKMFSNDNLIKVIKDYYEQMQ